MSIQFEFLDTNAVLSSISTDGVSYLELFLREYSQTSGIPFERLNVGCKNCISEYLNNYKKTKYKMENQSNYRLKEKYNGLPLEFGSSIYVTNANITDAYAKKLLKNYKAESIFDVFPKEEINVVVETATETKVRAPRRATSKKIKND